MCKAGTSRRSCKGGHLQLSERQCMKCCWYPSHTTRVARCDTLQLHRHLAKSLRMRNGVIPCLSILDGCRP
eukprot:1785-Eustigmatos_ZCMA.PRE.1